MNFETSNFILEDLPIINFSSLSSTLCNETKSLLLEWNLVELIPDFERKEINLEVLSNLNVEDINLLIPESQFGKRIIFRTRLFEWRNRNKVVQTADTISIGQSSIVSTSISNISTSTISVATELNLKQLLESSVNGRNLLSNYNTNKFLTSKERQYIVKIIADIWVNSERQITKSDYKSAADQIVLLFPTEDKDIYLGDDGQRGKLAEKYYGLSKKYQKEGFLQSRYKLKKNLNVQLNEEQLLNKEHTIDEIDSNIESHQIWLKNNFSPDSLVIEKWNITFALRRKDILNNKNFKDLLTQWPIISKKIGASLIELDFEKLYPSKNLLLFSKWKIFEEKIIPIYKREIKDTQNKDLLKVWEKEINENSKNYILIILLNALLKPQIIKESKRQWKPSILDGQNSLVIHVTQKSFIESTINIKKDEYLTKNLTIQPTIVVVGDSIENLTHFFLYVNDILYETESFLKALSTTFQLYQVLNFHYDRQCRQVWNFVEQYFYEIPMSSQKTPALSSLLTALK